MLPAVPRPARLAQLGTRLMLTLPGLVVAVVAVVGRWPPLGVMVAWAVSMAAVAAAGEHLSTASIPVRVATVGPGSF